jgi:hypothetical protein
VNVTLHGLRHSHISELLAAGVPIKVVSERAGHASISVTADIYGHLLDGGQAAAIAAEGKLRAAVERAGSAEFDTSSDTERKRRKRSGSREDNRSCAIIRLPEQKIG